ncbi:phosphonate C-P lyase system protein PhnG [Pseudomonadota bacterium AL_CKDN230030165-1A_HGKHYDSX7]
MDSSPNPNEAERAAWMRVLALADPQRLDALYDALEPIPDYRMLREPQTGMAMVRGRSGGTGEPFNLGEVTVTRCAITLDPGVMGVAYVQGRGRRHARQAAVADALMQLADWRPRIERDLLAPLAHEQAERAGRRAGAAAQSRVEFFTMVRGED